MEHLCWPASPEYWGPKLFFVSCILNPREFLNFSRSVLYMEIFFSGKEPDLVALALVQSKAPLKNISKKSSKFFYEIDKDGGGEESANF
jgi:hypothetical protein